MAKKKTTRKRSVASKRGKRKTGNMASAFFDNMKQLLKWACLSLFIFILSLFILDHLHLLPSQVSKLRERKFEIGLELPSAGSTAKSDKENTFLLPDKAEIPWLVSNRKEQIIEHEGYTVSYNSDYKIANWVAYELTKEEVEIKRAERTNKFVPDPMVKGATATNEDYTRTGFDRGHLAPAADMNWSAKALRESFYFSNICPQNPGLNRGVWKNLEDQVRVWALENKAVLVATGPVIEERMRQMGKNRIGVPSKFYKVIGMQINNKTVGIGFLFDNKDYKKTSLKNFAVSVDSVEKITGIDFFYTLPEEVQREMESKIEWLYWSFTN